MLCCSVLLLPRLCAGPELPRLLLGVAVGGVARDADVLLLWPRHVVRFQEIELIIEIQSHPCQIYPAEFIWRHKW